MSPTPASSRPSKMRSFSCSSSLPNSCRRTCPISSTVPSSRRSEAKSPPDGSVSLIARLAAADQQADDQPHASGDANGAPGVVLNIVVGGLAGVLGAVDGHFLEIGKIRL